MGPRQLIFVTGNANKLKEVRAILGDTVEVVNRSLDLDELQGTIEEISKDKCRRAADIVGLQKSIMQHLSLCFLS
jgi:inosine triphosphate pyrophosphatase